MRNLDLNNYDVQEMNAREMKAAIQDLKQQGKTILIIAHRLSTAIDADKIAILENGVLIEEGAHDSLFKEGMRYYGMWKK